MLNLESPKITCLKTFKRKEVSWDVKLAWEYHNLMEGLVCAASTFCLNTLEELGRKCGRFNPDDRLLIPVNRMGATCEIKHIGPTGLPIALW